MVMYDCDQNDPDLPKISTSVSVTDPVTHYSCGNGRHTTYSVILESNDFCFSLPQSMVRRRFSEFIFLRRLLKVLQPNVKPPALQSRNFFRDRFSAEFIEQRMLQLEKFMQQVLAESLYLSNKALHLFLQSNLPMREIEAQVSGVLPVIPFEIGDSATLISDSSVSDTSSGDSECHACDYADGSISQCFNAKCTSLLSINSEALVTSMPFLPCSTDYPISSKKAPVKALLLSTDSIETPSDSSSLHSVSKSEHSDSSAANNIESSHMHKKRVSFCDSVSVMS